MNTYCKADGKVPILPSASTVCGAPWTSNVEGKDLVMWGAINGEQLKAEVTEAPTKWGGLPPF